MWGTCSSSSLKCGQQRSPASIRRYNRDHHLQREAKNKKVQLPAQTELPVARNVLVIENVYHREEPPADTEPPVETEEVKRHDCFL